MNDSSDAANDAIRIDPYVVAMLACERVIKEEGGGAETLVSVFSEVVTASLPATATPSILTLGSLHHPRLRLRAPLTLRIERENEHVTAWNHDLEEIGYGSTLVGAVEDFQRTVIELYESLQAEQERLGSDMARLWRKVQQHVDERR